MLNVCGISYLAEDDGIIEREDLLGVKIGKSILSGDLMATPIVMRSKEWTKRTYQYHLGLFAMSTRTTFAFLYGISAGVVIASVGTLMSIVRAANPEFPVVQIEE